MFAKKLAGLFTASLIASALFAQPVQTYRVNSPNNELHLDVHLEKDGSLNYSLHSTGIGWIQPSSLGLSMKEFKDFRTGFEVLDEVRTEVDETWTPVWGEESKIRNNYRQLVLKLQKKPVGLMSGDNSPKMNLVFRIFNDGLGFRYEFPEQKRLKHFVVMDEFTSFDLEGDHTAFWIPGDYDTNEYNPNTTLLSEVDASSGKYSSEITSKTFFDKNAVQTPLMMKTRSGYFINIHEAALVNYPAMNLVLDKSTFKLTSHLVPDAVGNKAYLQTPFSTPWRTIIVGTRATDILASRIILNLNEPNKIVNTSFIQPMKYVGVWWEMHVGKATWDYSGTQDASNRPVPHGRHGASTANVKRYIDFAARHGFKGVLVEGWNEGWEDWFGKWKENVFDFVTPYPDYDVKELHAYSKAKGVKIIAHHETSGSVTNYERYMDTAYRFMLNHGMNAVKTGYVGPIIPRGEHHDGQWMVNHYNRVARKTAGYGIMLDAHEPVRPTGLHRTWPNWMACEAARGMEFNAWSNGNNPDHETILPFTRLMGGPMDYTPGIFQTKMNVYDPTKKEQIRTTLVKQLALYVTLYSPLQMAADLPENYEKHPDAFRFIEDVAVDWDETRYLAAEPGDYLTIARRAKNTDNWFLGSITDENSRKMNVPLNFLDPARKYIATIYADAPDAHWDRNPQAYVISKFEVSHKTILKLALAESGGCAVSIIPATAEELKGVKKYK